MNRAFTSLSYDGKFASTFTNGDENPSTGVSAGFGIGRRDSACIIDPNSGSFRWPDLGWSWIDLDFLIPVHTQNETMASGTAFAISYQVSSLREISLLSSSRIPQSDITQVTPENLVVFTVLYQSVFCLVVSLYISDALCM
jgi:hypothetical protein